MKREHGFIERLEKIQENTDVFLSFISRSGKLGFPVIASLSLLLIIFSLFILFL